MVPSSVQLNSDLEAPSPWRSLPSDILERALALLPLPDIYRLRAVCKRWHGLIHCAQFQEMSSRSPSSWGPFYSPRVGWKGRGSPVVPWSSYDLVLRKWRTLPELQFPAWARNCGWNLMAADGGLLGFGALDGRGILVCNPMSNRWKELPAVSGGARTPVISQMMVSEQKNSYKILLAGHSAHKQPDSRFTRNLVDIYDSQSSTWTSAETLHDDLLLCSGACCRGAFFLLTRHLRTGVHAVVALDLATLRWRGRPLPIPEDLKYPYIVACSGSVYLVGGSSEATDRMPMASIGVFLLQEPRLVSGSGSGSCSSLSCSRWGKVGEYANGPFLHSTGAIYGCGASGSKIYVVTYAYDMWMAVFDCVAGEWEAPIKGNFFDMKDIFGTKFGFQPNLGVAP